jgi:hypothetical protein
LQQPQPLAATAASPARVAAPAAGLQKPAAGADTPMGPREGTLASAGVSGLGGGGGGDRGGCHGPQVEHAARELHSEGSGGVDSSRGSRYTAQLKASYTSAARLKASCTGRTRRARVA